MDSVQVLPYLPTGGPGVHSSAVVQGLGLPLLAFCVICTSHCQCNQERPSLSAVRLWWFLDHVGYTDCIRKSIAFTKHIPASLCTFNREIKPIKYLIKSIEIISHHVQDAQEGGGTPPTDPGTRGKNPAELSSEMQDVASLTALKFLIFWLFLAWSWEAPVATGCENTLIWGKQTQHSFFYSFPQQRSYLGENAGWPGSSRKDTRNEMCQYYSLFLSKFIFINSSNTPLFPVVSGKYLATVPDISSYNVQMDKASFLPFSK